MNTKLHAALAVLALLADIGLTSLALSAPAYAVDNMTSTDAPDLTSVRAKIKAKGLPRRTHRTASAGGGCPAGRCLQPARIHPAQDRRLGCLPLTYYTKAIEMAPEHKAAREYLGELYVETGNMEKAKEQLAVLAKLCPGGCEEREDLQKAISAKSARN